MLGELPLSGKTRKDDEMAENGQVSHLNGVEEDSEDDMVEEEMPGGIVFQCNGCNTILGDTMSWVDGNTEMGTFTIHRASEDVELGTSIKASQAGIDEGSTYKDVKCSCKAKVGRYYLATTSGVDHLRKMYTLYASSIKIYKLNGGRVDAEHGLVTAGGLPLLNQHDLTEYVRKVQGIILQICSQLEKCSNKLGIPIDSALCIPEFDAAPPSNQETSPPAKVKIDNDEDKKQFLKNHYDSHSDEELSHSHNSKSSVKSSSAEGGRKRERSESSGTAQSSLNSERRKKKSKH